MSVTVLGFESVGGPHLPVLLVVGLAVFGGTMGARVFQALRVPQVVGYIAIGICAGRMGLGLIDQQAVADLMPFNFLALGVIGFMIGGELHKDVFRRFGRQFFSILVAEGMTAFVLAGALVGAVVWWMTGNAAKAVALGGLLGAIASATAPAATVDVLWEYKARGPLTAAVFAIVALDDALALILFALASSVAARVLGGGDVGLAIFLGHAALEILGGVAVGVAMGFLLEFVLRRSRDQDKSLAYAIGAVMLVIGASRALGLDVIMSAMALGATVRNLVPRRSSEAFDVVKRFSPPIYVLFFVLLGARMDLAAMPGWMWVVAAAYLVGRSVGKIAGANIGARLAGATDAVRRYLGLALFSQAGVAIGLALLASVRFSDETGTAILTIVTATTMIVQLVGPSFVKLAIVRAGEAGRDVTEFDLMKAMRVDEVMDRKAPSFSAAAHLPEILKGVADTDSSAYPVLDEEGRMAGIITLQGLKQSFALEDDGEWCLAYDLMETPPDGVGPGATLEDAVERMREQHVDYLPVLDAGQSKRLVGIVAMHALTRHVSRELLLRRGEADVEEVGLSRAAG